MKDITQKAMLCRLRIGMWGAEKLDRKLTAEITTQKKAKSNAARVTKTLYESPFLNEYRTLAGATRQYARDLTMPWDDNATRLLPVAMFDDYSQGIQPLLSALDDAKEAVFDDFKDCQTREQARMGDMYNPADFPSVEAIQGKFYHDTQFWPIPSAGDWRVDMDTQRMAEIESSTENMVNQRLESAMGDLWERTYERVKKLWENLSKEDRYYDSHLDNLTELVEMLPDMNLTADPRLSKLAEDLRLNLCTKSMDDFRKDIGARGDAIKASRDAMTTIEGFGMFAPAK